MYNVHVRRFIVMARESLQVSLVSPTLFDGSLNDIQSHLCLFRQKYQDFVLGLQQIFIILYKSYKQFL